MSRKYDQISPPESAIPAGACGTAVHDTPILGNPVLMSLVNVDLAAEAAAREAGEVSARLASGALSLTNLKSDAMPRLLHRP